MFAPQTGSIKKQTWIKPPPEKVKTEERTMYSSLKCVLIGSQFMGLLPLSNITKGQEKIRFKWFDLRVFYSIFFIVLSGSGMLVCAACGFERGYNLMRLADQTFYSGSLITMILYFNLARGWSEIVNKWCNMDQIMNKTYGYPKHMDLSIKFYSMLFFILGIIDHGLSVTSRYTSLRSIYRDNYTSAYYYNKTFPELFYYVNYNLPLGIYTSLVVTHANLCWAFNDLFIILMSLLLASRFNQISERIKKEHATVQTVLFWKEIRQDYDRLCHLCVDLNNKISHMLLLSYFQNIAFILVQLFNSLKEFPRIFEKIYFIYSSCYLLFKTISVSLHASSINDASKRPALYLNNVPSKGYNLEIKRLLTQISFDTVVLSGCKMFKITRGLILSIATAIVTYELLLIQLTAYLVVEEKKDDGVH
ncbi:gustatory receptor for sugar taste 64e-like [Anthonomus grandis grandis]|uniref:gustatory receptor for sugar taste 64e-like n=1 Tax=Anthonomus grandis grandis TaxID=2921223 RepID=UPI00216654FA|nr:gustatory receptor for sugar taste 64e-like [Anthonomus grandis grandis]